MKTLLPIALATVLLAGCATGYHRYNALAGGYKEQAIAPNVTEVTFLSNGFSTAEQTYHYAMRRAAELTLAGGHRYFEVLSKSNLMRREISYAGGMSTTSFHPKTVLKIKFLAKKSASAYDANKVLSQTQK